MAGGFGVTVRNRSNKLALAAYTPPMSKGWGVLGFAREAANASLPGASSTGSQDVRIPVGSNQINQVFPTNWSWLQLRQYQCLLSRRWNIADAATKMAEQKVPYLQLATNKTGTGLGQGRLKNINLNSPSNFNNLLARATAYGRYQNRVPVQ